MFETKSTFCNLIERDPVAGTLWVSPGQIITTNTNVSESGLTGYDITFTYPLETPIGVVDLKGIQQLLIQIRLSLYPALRNYNVLVIMVNHAAKILHLSLQETTLRLSQEVTLITYLALDSWVKLKILIA